MTMMIWPLLLTLVTAYPLARYSLGMRYQDGSRVTQDGARLAISVLVAVTIIFQTMALYVASNNPSGGLWLAFVVAAIQAMVQAGIAVAVADERDQHQHQHTDRTDGEKSR